MIPSQINGSFGAIYFRYDIDNITMRYTIEYEGWTHFLISIFAIMGGSFALLGLLNQTLNKIKA
jgi:hypothetical protein